MTWLRYLLCTYADGARPRTEILWINPAAEAALAAARAQGCLLERAAQ
jgi:hypothetical protein